jgi:uncharacterized SAM-binding protein YcdF (DUF218 family)
MQHVTSLQQEAEAAPIVVLGCRVAYEKSSPIALTGELAYRVRHAVHLAQSGTKLVFSGGKRWHGVQECEAMAAFAQQIGADNSCFVLEPWSQNTRQNAQYTRLLLAPTLGTILLVTSPWHAKRARERFEHEGFAVKDASAPLRPNSPHLRHSLRELIARQKDRLLDRL